MHRFLLFAMFLLTACQTMPPVSFTPEQVSVLKENGFVESDDGWELGMNDRLLFPTDESLLGEQQKMVITQLTHALLNVGIHGAKVTGHTDSTGPEDYNKTLSLQRAQAVKAGMVAAGMAGNEIRTDGAGELEPIATNETIEGRQENRRVVIRVSSFDATAQ